MTTPATTTPTWVDMSITQVRRAAHDDPTRRVHVVILEETGGTRTLPIWTGEFEAVALAGSLEHVEMPRPMTYQFAAALLDAATSHVEEVRISQLTDSVFYAVVVVTSGDGTHEVDARPSDALNLAAIVGAPIRVDSRILADPKATYTGWTNYPTSAPELVAEAQHRHSLTVRMLEHDE